MNREPIYHKDMGHSGHLRVISWPNGQWVAQEKGGGPATKERDPWINLHSPSTQEAAMSKMYMVLPSRS
jgi:hypothetical protein